MQRVPHPSRVSKGGVLNFPPLRLQNRETQGWGTLKQTWGTQLTTECFLCHAVVMDHTLGTALLLAGGIGLLALLRRLSRPIEAASVEPPNIPTLPLPVPEERNEQSRLRIRNHYFRSFDSDAGPLDPECFYDELFLELENTESGESWTNSYFVGTPSGIAQVMREEGWDEMFGTDLLIVRCFDRELILRSLLERIEEQYEIVPEPPHDPHLG